MTQPTTRSQAAKDKDPQWPIVCSRQNLLTACWGSKKGADLLYHFVNKARWEISNQNLSMSVKVIKFNEERDEIFEGIEKARAGNSISQGMYNTLLRDFVEVGYMVNQPYSTLFEVNLDAIEKAFSNPPQRPVRQSRKPKHNDEVCVNLTDHNNDTISRAEYDSLAEICVNLSKSCQCLSIQVAELTLMCQSLNQSTSINAASQAGSIATTGTQNHDIREVMINDDEKDANASLTPASSSKQLPVSEEAQTQIAYSQRVTTPSEQNKEKDVVGAARGYRTNTDANTLPEQENKKSAANIRERGKRSKKTEKAEQPNLPFGNEIALNEDEQRISDWFCKFWFIKIPPKVNALYKKHCGTLVPFVHSWEEMQSLEKVARAYLQSQLKPGTKVGGLHLGNLTNANVLNDWQPDLPFNIVAIDSKQRSGVDTFAHVPAFGGRTEEQMEQEVAALPETLEFLRSRGVAI